jgi:para-nitrobenzyl esterase
MSDGEPHGQSGAVHDDAAQALAEHVGESSMRPLLSSLALAIAAFAATPTAAQIARAEVTGGTVEGQVTEDLAVFKGIPYAVPPTGANRWRAPQPVAAWQGIRPAAEFGAACMQAEPMLRQMGSTRPMSEDCLFADVWRPAAAAASDRLPVMVWIHGGGYTGGAPSVALYDGANFARRGVVFVSLAYRLGAYGFLAAPELSAESGQGSGNYGLLDMVAGLEWVRDNIEQFGGDPARVTIMGHSAGSSAVSILAASPLARGLFHGVIAESGANFAPVQGDEPFAGGGLFTLAASERQGSAWLATLGADSLAEARALPAGELNAAQNAEGAPSWRPRLDNHVLTADQVALWERGDFADVPLLVGHTSNEWGAGRAPAGDFASTIRAAYGAFADRVLAAYPHATPEEAAASARALGNELSMNSNAYLYARSQAEHGRAPAWYYHFHNAPEGSGHGSEVGLVFANEDARQGREPWDARTRALSRQLQGYWVNFAKRGDPNGPGLPAWPRFDPAEPSVLEVGLETKVVDVPGRQRLDVLADYFAWRREGSGG